MSVNSILFMFTGLSVGIGTMQVLNYLNDAIPYTVVIFIVGAFIAMVSRTQNGLWEDSVDDWEVLDPEMILFVFLPPLVFGEAMSLNWLHVKGGFLQSSVLAGPGVVIGALVMGALTKMILPYNWSWILSMTFGSILSATDPVAVVALLKSASASPKLTILIVGESLLNDGTAMVMFGVFFEILNGGKFSVAENIGYLTNALLGSAGFGIFCGLVIVRWLRSANRKFKEIDQSIQITVTICSSYLIFYTAQYVFNQSGVLACCFAGGMLAWLAPPIILNQDGMHKVWGMIEWFGNTLIFLLAGLRLGNILIDVVSLQDYGFLVLLYVLLMLIRVMIIAIFYPFLRSYGHKCTFNEAVFMSWAGLRGALSMCLALILRSNNSSTDVSDEEGSRFFFYVGGIAALTLIINATFAKTVLFHLGLLGENSFEKAIISKQIRRRLRIKMSKTAQEIEKKASLTSEDALSLRECCALLREQYHDSKDGASESQQSQLSQITQSQSLFIGNSQSMATMSPIIVSDSPMIRLMQASAQQPNSPQASTLLRRISYDRQESCQDNMEISRLLNLSKSNSLFLSSSNNSQKLPLSDELVQYHRAVLLEIVRAHYWKDIESGKLPRNGHSALFLLFSIDVGLDKLGESCLQDWHCIEEELDRNPFLISLLFKVGKFTNSHYILDLLGRFEARFEKRAVYILTSFIDAHEHAQKKLHEYSQVVEDDGKSITVTPEENLVKTESINAVKKARERLANMCKVTIQSIRLKQVSRMLLAKEAQLVQNMLDEGLMSQQNAEEFFDEIEGDIAQIEKDREILAKHHEVSKARQRTKASGKREIARVYDEYSIKGHFNFQNSQSVNTKNAFALLSANSSVDHSKTDTDGSNAEDHSDLRSPLLEDNSGKKKSIGK